MIGKQFDHFAQPLAEFIKSLTTQCGDKVEIINQVPNKQHTLLSIADMFNSKIFKNNPLPVDLYIRNVLVPSAEDENKYNNNNNNENVLMRHFEEFEANVINQLKSIKNIIGEISCEVAKKKASNFMDAFSNGGLTDRNNFMMSLQSMIAYVATSTETKTRKFNRISELLEKLNQSCRETIDWLILEKQIMDSPEWEYFKKFEFIDRFEINEGKSIPFTNGIDIHPTKNIFIAMGCYDGDIVIRDQYTNKEIARVKLNNNSGGCTQNCLWSPSGNKIMVSTRKNHSIYIFDETGQNLLKLMENIYSHDGWGAIWLSEQMVAVGYDDGTMKFFNVEEGNEIRSIKGSGVCVWGMDCIDDSHLVVGDYNGSITNINWKNNRIEWIKENWHSNYKDIGCLRLNQNKSKLLTGSFDYFVKLMRMNDQSQLWEFEMKNPVNGISWVPGELYVLALSSINQLVILNSNDGTKILEFDELSIDSMSLRLNPRIAEVLVGDADGTIRRLKICQA